MNRRSDKRTAHANYAGVRVEVVVQVDTVVDVAAVQVDAKAVVAAVITQPSQRSQQHPSPLFLKNKDGGRRS
jgi:hypothetical protein